MLLHEYHPSPARYALIQMSSVFHRYQHIRSAALQVLHLPRPADSLPRMTFLVVTKELLRQYKGVSLPRPWIGCRNKLQPLWLVSQQACVVVLLRQQGKRYIIIREPMWMLSSHINNDRATVMPSKDPRLGQSMPRCRQHTEIT